MKNLLEKLKGVISEDDVKSLQESFTKSVDETVALKLEESKKEIEATFKADFDKKLTEETEKLKTLNESEIAEKSQLLEEKLIDKLDIFNESFIDENFTKELVESVAEQQVCKPIVEAIQSVFQEKYVALDTKGFGLLKEAKEEILRAKEEINKLHAKNIELTESIEKEKTEKLLVEKTNDLTGEQKDRVLAMFEGKSFDEVNSKIDTFLDIVKAKKTEEPAPIITEKVNDGLDTSVKPLNENVSTLEKSVLLAGNLVNKLNERSK